MKYLLIGVEVLVVLILMACQCEHQTKGLRKLYLPFGHHDQFQV